MKNIEEVNQEKNKGTTVKFISVIGILLVVIAAVIRLVDYAFENKYEHYFGDKSQYIENITPEEQDKLLSAFHIVIPDEEKKAYIKYFGKMTFSENYNIYFVEFDGVESFDAFYSVNPNRQSWVNQTAGVKENIYLTYAIKILGDDQETEKLYRLFEECSPAR